MGYRPEEIDRMCPADVFDLWGAYQKERDRQEYNLAWQTALLMSASLRKKIRPERLLRKQPAPRPGGDEKTRLKQRLPRDVTSAAKPASAFDQLAEDLGG